MPQTLTPQQQVVHDRIEVLAPLCEIVESDAFAEVLAGLQAQRAAFLDDALLFAHINGLVEIMPRLKAALAGLPTEVSPVSGPPPA